MFPRRAVHTLFEILIETLTQKIYKELYKLYAFFQQSCDNYYASNDKNLKIAVQARHQHAKSERD